MVNCSISLHLGMALVDNEERMLHIDIDIEEKNCILNEVRSTKVVKRSIEKEKEEIQNKIARHLKDINSPTKLQIIKNTLASLSPTLAAVNSSSNSFKSSFMTPHNKKIMPQRALFSTRKKICKKSKTLTRQTTDDTTLNLLFMSNTNK